MLTLLLIKIQMFKKYILGKRTNLYSNSLGYRWFLMRTFFFNIFSAFVLKRALVALFCCCYATCKSRSIRHRFGIFFSFFFIDRIRLPICDSYSLRPLTRPDCFPGALQGGRNRVFARLWLDNPDASTQLWLPWLLVISFSFSNSSLTFTWGLIIHE